MVRAAYDKKCAPSFSPLFNNHFDEKANPKHDQEIKETMIARMALLWNQFKNNKWEYWQL
jgi:hypothetical protein